MRYSFWLTAAVVFLGLAGFVEASSPAGAADLRGARVYRAAPHRVALQRRPVCPIYECMALYGAYGPYGGQAYWTAYTSGGYYSGNVVRVRY